MAETDAHSRAVAPSFSGSFGSLSVASLCSPLLSVSLLSFTLSVSVGIIAAAAEFPSRKSAEMSPAAGFGCGNSGFCGFCPLRFSNTGSRLRQKLSLQTMFCCQQAASIASTSASLSRIARATGSVTRVFDSRYSQSAERLQLKEKSLESPSNSSSLNQNAYPSLPQRASKIAMVLPLWVMWGK